MILNEEYFDNLDIKEEDIIDDYPDNELDDFTFAENEIIDYHDIYHRYIQHYSVELSFVINNKLNAEILEEITPHFLKNISKKMNQLCDLYDIEHSEMFVFLTSQDEQQYSHQDKIMIIECDGYKMLQPVRCSLDQCQFWKITYFITYPKMTYKDAIKFYMHIQDIFWYKRNKNLFNYIMIGTNEALDKDDRYGTALSRKNHYYKDRNVNISDIYSLENWNAFLPIIANVFGIKTRDEMIAKLENRLNPFTGEWI